MSEQPATPKPRSPGTPLGKRIMRSRAMHWVIARAFRAGVGILQSMEPERSAGFASAVLRTVAPLFPENRLGARNIAAALPEKSEAERKRILAGAWDNIARVAAEYIHLDAIAAQDPVVEGEGEGRLVIRGVEQFQSLRDDGKPAVIFAAHMANWELLAVTAVRYGLPLTAMFRPPSNMLVAGDLLQRRRALMGGLVANTRGATFELAAALERGEHLGLLVDQSKARGMPVPFFGRPAPTNPLLGKLARTFECPVHGARSVRLPGGRFLIEITPPLDLPRDHEGKIDVFGTMAMVNLTIEGWIREHPEQWLWLHDRWRN